MRCKDFLLLMLLVLPFSARAQVSPHALGSDPHLWVGAEISDYHTDYNPIGGRLLGIGFYGDYLLSHHLGAEAEIRLLDLNSPGGQTQKNYFLGPIIDVYHYHRFSGYGKALLGLTSINYPNNVGYGSYFAYAIGGGVEYRIRPHWKIRGEYEHQFIPSAPGFVITRPYPSSGLNPSGYSAGLSYRFF